MHVKQKLTNASLFIVAITIIIQSGQTGLSSEKQEDAIARENQRIPEFKNLERPLGVPLPCLMNKETPKREGTCLRSHGNGRAS